MSITKQITLGAGAAWLSRGVSVFVGLVLLPVLFRNFTKEELGVWLLLGQSWATLGIFELGFGVTLTRRIAFAKGKSGSDPGALLTEETIQEIADLVATGKRVYRALALFTFAFSIGAGFFYLRTLHLGAMPISQVWMAWGILCLSQTLGVWANVWNSVLLGVGYVGWDAVLGSLASILTMLAQIGVVLLGGGLIALATAAAVGALTQRFLMLGFARRRRPEIFSIRGHWCGEVFYSMISPALLAWLTGLGTVLVFQTDSFFIAGFFGVGQIPAYRGAFLIALNLHMLAGVFAGASAVFLSHLWTEGNFAEVRRVVTRNLRIGLFLMLTGSACVLVLGERLFNLWLGKGNFIGYPTLAVLLALFVMEQHSYIISTSSRATENEVFAICSLAAGVLKLVFAWLLVRQWGFLGIALATALALILTNHWYMVYRGLARLQISWREHVWRVLLPCAGVFALSVVACRCALELLKPFAPVIQVAGISAVSGIVLILALWQWVLEADLRRRILARIGWPISSNLPGSK